MNQTASYNLRRPQIYFLAVGAEQPKDADYALVRAAAGGAIMAFGDLYKRHNRRVYSLCLRMTRNVADAEDLTQEVFLQLFRKIDSFRGESPFTTWLHRLTINLVLMSFRRATKRREKIVEDMEAEISTLQWDKHSARSQVVDKIALDAAQAQLPPGQRLMFVLHDIEGYSHEEIASMRGCSVGTSKSQLHKARMSLRRLLNSDRQAPASVVPTA